MSTITLYKKILNVIQEGRLRETVVMRVCKKFFLGAEKYLKIHLTPVHFFSPIPNVSELDEKVFNENFSCTGIDWNIKEQLNFLEHTIPEYRGEFIPTKNTGLTLVDSFILYTLIRKKKPKFMVEIGGGETTMISLQAIQKNRDEGFNCKFTCIEPYPSEKLKNIKFDQFELIEKKVQDVDIDAMKDADILFIDSSHVSKIGSDVNYEILELVPRLKKGTLIHWHDILIPKNYWKDWIMDGNQFWNESYMVHSFMLFNKSFKIIWASQYMSINYQIKIKDLLSFYEKHHRLTSFWIERVS